MSTTGGAILARALRNFGVTHLFSIPGHQNLSVLDGCIDEGISVISARHEAAAVHMAEGVSFAGREPGVALLAGGPELTNAVTGLAKAFLANTPLVVIAGANPPKKLDRGFPQDLDQLELVRPFTKWARSCFDIARIPEYLATAFRHALRGRPGPVYLEIPYDVLEQRVRAEGVPFPEPESPLRACADQSAVQQAVQLLEAAERPIAIAGSGVFWSGAEAELQAFIERSGLPLFPTNAALALHLSSGMVAGLGNPAGGRPSVNAIAQADVIFLIGTRVNFALGFGREPFMSTGQSVIQLDIEPAEIGSHRRIDVGMAGDCRATLQLMNSQSLAMQPLGDWRARLTKEQEAFSREINPQATSTQVPIHPLRLVREIEQHREADSFLVLDGANSLLWMLMSVESARTGGTLVSSMGMLEAIGTGIPQAIALKLKHPENQVILHTGDGSFGYYAMEFETAVRANVPFVAVVHNDLGWGMTRDMQVEFFGKDRQIGNQLGLVRYDLMVESLGGYGELVEDPAELGPALRRAEESGLPACLNVLVDPEPKSPGFMMFLLLEIMLGKESVYDRIPDLVEGLKRWGLGGLASKRILASLQGRLHGKMR